MCRNDPKLTAFSILLILFTFVSQKTVMFNLNEDNRIVMAQHPTDMRMGVNGMCGQVRKVGLEPSNCDVYVFVGKSRTTMKLLHWERGGYVM